jgi:PAS domain S-box-containing protein
MSPPFAARMPLWLPKALAGICIASAATAIVVLAGWSADIDSFKRILPGLVSMNPLTAVAFVVASFALWLRRKPPTSASVAGARAASVAAAIVAAIGLGKLGMYAGWWDLRMDQWLFAAKLDDDASPFPNRMAPNTALNFFLLGSALLIPDALTRRGGRPGEWLALGVAVISLLALMGYAYEVRWFYGIAAFIPMALHTALLFHLLAIGTLFSRPDRGFVGLFLSESPGGALMRTLLPGTVTILFVVGWLQLEGERRGLYGTELGVALHALVNIVLFGAMIWWCARSLHRTDEARRREEAERERFFALSLDLLAIAGLDGYFKRVNPAFAEILGHPTQTLLAHPFLDFVHPDDREATLAEIGKLKEGAPTLHFENRYRCADGTWRWISWKTQPYPDERLLYATGHDVTAERAAGDAIRELNRSLEQRALQLEEANRELEAFSYSVSHDLRAPLRHIQGYAEMLESATRGQLAEKPARYLRTIATAGEEMGRLIDDLLAFSRMGRTELHQTRVALEPMLRDTLAGFETLTRGRDIEWRTSPLPDVLGDAAMIRQVLANLVGNALKYTRNRERTVIEFDHAGEEHGLPVFRIRDNGAGFDMQYAHKLFGVFQRLHRSDEFEGTGIGLAIVRRIVARHGGRVWAEGSVGTGATFYFTLPPTGGTPTPQTANP